MKSFVAGLVVFLVLIAALPVRADIPARPAPAWEISEWLNSKPLNVTDLRGQVVVIDFFQLWCPGCNKFSIPLMHHWKQVFAGEIGNKKLAIISIHTVFEGHDYQNPQRLRRFLKEKDITHPVGIDKNVEGQYVPVTMQRYKTRGTPEIAFLDKKGQIRFQKFGYFDPEKATSFIRALLAE